MPNSTTQVYFIRHGIAAERGTYVNDAQRPLIQKGLLKTKQVAQRLAALDLYFDTLLSSPLVRAVQTAELLCQADLATAFQVFEPLAPGGNLQDWLDWLGERSLGHETVALVGHAPDLSEWAQQLVQGGHDAQWVLKKAGIIGVSLSDPQNAIGHSQLFWLAPPRFMV
ncbi:MAG: phosphohistidine phosphatase SixA [Cyanobacteria bacterium P01_A01_bin.15]